MPPQAYQNRMAELGAEQDFDVFPSTFQLLDIG
ncbi:hypothetical protein Leryth_023069 [Lithospermum erythrorhizon]|nr:hypothetical protein Leryth_023069 [Lithospermum erythrorhizon]